MKAGSRDAPLALQDLALSNMQEVIVPILLPYQYEKLATPSQLECRNLAGRALTNK